MLAVRQLYMNFISPKWQHNTRIYKEQNIQKVQVMHRQKSNASHWS